MTLLFVFELLLISLGDGDTFNNVDQNCCPLERLSFFNISFSLVTFVVIEYVDILGKISSFTVFTF